MVQAIRNLAELLNKGGSIRAECSCGRVAIFALADLLGHYRRKGWSDAWPSFAQRLRCRTCGQREPRVAWLINEPPPPDDPPPPKPRFIRNAVPPGISPAEWANAPNDRERRRLIRIVRN